MFGINTAIWWQSLNLTGQEMAIAVGIAEKVVSKGTTLTNITEAQKTALYRKYNKKKKKKK